MSEQQPFSVGGDSASGFLNSVYKPDVCGCPRKLDNLTWCKMPVKLTRKGRAFYEKVV